MVSIMAILIALTVCVVVKMVYVVQTAKSVKIETVRKDGVIVRELWKPRIWRGDVGWLLVAGSVQKENAVLPFHGAAKGNCFATLSNRDSAIYNRSVDTSYLISKIQLSHHAINSLAT